VSSALYAGHLAHARAAPVRHSFRYPIYMLLVDLDELPALDARLRCFGHNRANLVSLRDRDYLGGGALKPSLMRFLDENGVSIPGLRVYALTHARVLGYVFNPVTFFYCYDFCNNLVCVIAEVNNTFGDTHRYLLDERNRIASPRGQSYAHDKLLHVSPFIGMGARYRFHFPTAPLADDLEVRMDVEVERAPLFVARFVGRRRPLDDAGLIAMLLRYPLMTLQVIGLIHLEALKLYLKGAPFHHQPPYDPEAARRLHAELTGASR
jgi:DUF1365 family protein